MMWSIAVLVCISNSTNISQYISPMEALNDEAKSVVGVRVPSIYEDLRCDGEQLKFPPTKTWEVNKNHHQGITAFIVILNTPCQHFSKTLHQCPKVSRVLKLLVLVALLVFLPHPKWSPSISHHPCPHLKKACALRWAKAPGFPLPTRSESPCGWLVAKIRGFF